MASKVLKVKLWEDDAGAKWKQNVQDIEGDVLCGQSALAYTFVYLGSRLLTLLAVSQFTLLASVKKGNKPDFHKSAGPTAAKDLYTSFFTKLQSLYTADRVKDGIFQAMMDVALVNDGPVGVDYGCDDGVVLTVRAIICI